MILGPDVIFATLGSCVLEFYFLPFIGFFVWNISYKCIIANVPKLLIILDVLSFIVLYTPLNVATKLIVFIKRSNSHFWIWLAGVNDEIGEEFVVFIDLHAGTYF